MILVEVKRDIAAAPEVVFESITAVERLPEVDPDVVSVEFLSEQRRGVGTRFIETRRMGSKEMRSDLEVTEFEAGRSVRMVTSNGGTVWDTLFTVAPSASGAELTIAMEAKPYKLLAKLLMPLGKGAFKRGMEKHIDAVKQRCEAH